MADILIRGMETPKTCSDCPCFVWDVNAVSSSPILAAQNDGTMVCAFTREEIWNTKRGDLCPLVPLPEGHGRLGDLDALMNNIGDVPYKGAVRRVLMSAPTIIEADLEWKMKNCCCFSNTDQAEGGTEDGN